MFSCQMRFSHSSSTYSHVFTDPSIVLFHGSFVDTSSSLGEPPLAASDLPDSTDDHPSTSQIPESSLEPRHSSRVRASPAHLHNYHCLSTLATLHEHHSYHETSAKPLWQKVMSYELDALSKTHTWDMMDLPHGKFTEGCKWSGFIKSRPV